MQKRLVRSNSDRMLGGVCGGIGQYLDIDSTLIRLLFVVGVVFFGVSPLIYVLLWVFIPHELSAPAYPQQLPDHARDQDPTGEWRYDPYTGQPIQREEQPY
jgi:phage shock protein C